MKPNEFFRTLYGVDFDAWLTVFLLPGSSAHWFRHDQLAEAESFCLDAARTSDVYFGVGLRHTNLGPSKRGRADDVVGIPGLWLDLDVKPGAVPTLPDAYQLLDDFPRRPTLVVKSGNGLHAYWCFKELWTLESAEERQKAASLCQRLQHAFKERARQRNWALDSTFDLARVLRVPGTMNHKDKAKPRPVEVLER